MDRRTPDAQRARRTCGSRRSSTSTATRGCTSSWRRSARRPASPAWSAGTCGCPPRWRGWVPDWRSPTTAPTGRGSRASEWKRPGPRGTSWPRQVISTAQHTVVVCAHHDAARTGKFFNQGHQQFLVERFPGIAERINTSLPNWWPPILAPALAGVARCAAAARMMVAGAAMSAAVAALFADIARSPVVPGANDNLVCRRADRRTGRAAARAAGERRAGPAGFARRRGSSCRAASTDSWRATSPSSTASARTF